MTNRVLIDASHPQEMRLVVSDEKNNVSEIDFQNAKNQHSKGNIYLAKIARVEPSLQAAFIEYGNDRNGFLPFSEIHPDYFQISSAEKEKLLQKIEELNASSESTTGRADFASRRQYNELFAEFKIQEVVKKDQIILVQLTKEARGSKGAAFSAYISIPGRFCVYMPNSPSQGGVSKKIAEAEERDRLKSLLDEFNSKQSNQGSVIIRTAGEFKTKTEIRRDFEYTVKLWNNIKENALNSTAPCFVYEEADIIKKAIRDMYNSDIEEIIIAGKEAYESTVSFMELILPRHVEKVKFHKSSTPIFTEYDLDDELNQLYHGEVSLKSGGSIVIQPTEALVSIDVNSGKFTDERNIENTALKTNLEAAETIAKQVMLRSLSGIVVIDFIDMKIDENKAKVERTLRQAFKSDKAKVVFNKIGAFGLFVLSRQRVKPSFLESNTEKCSQCHGRGVVRRHELTLASIIRNLHVFLQKGNLIEIKLIANTNTIFALMRQHKYTLAKLETKSHCTISFETDDTISADSFYIEPVTEGLKRNTNVALSTAEDVEYGVEDQPEKEEQKGRKPKSSSRKADQGEKADKDEKKGKVSKKPSGRRKIASDGNKADSDKPRRQPRKKAEKSEEMPNADKKPTAEADSDDPNNSLLKDIWRKIID